MALKRADVEKFAEEHGIELEITEFSKKYTNHGRSGYPPGVAGTGINHVHAYTKTGEIFGSMDLHNMSLWDCDCAEKINWTEVMADLVDHMPVPCPSALANGGAGCEVCDEDESPSHTDEEEEESYGPEETGASLDCSA